MKILKIPLRGYSVKDQGIKIVGQLERTRMFTALQIKSRFKNQNYTSCLARRYLIFWLYGYTGRVVFLEYVLCIQYFGFF